jgi:hypothetical protein
MKSAALAMLLVACTSGPESIPGDTSPDDPTEQPDETTGLKTDKPLQTITLGTGVVMATPTVVHVYWGSYWASDAGAADRAIIDNFTARVGATSWWNVSSEYADHEGNTPGVPTAGSAVLATDGDPPTKLFSTDVDLHRFLTGQLTSGALTYDPETMYMVFPQPGTTGPRGECGHHSYFTASTPDGKRKVIYALVPYLGNDPSCGVNVEVNGAALDQITPTLAHEIAEAASDPYLNAWMTADGVEIADQCDSGYAADFGAVQDLWSNASSSCVH